MPSWSPSSALGQPGRRLHCAILIGVAKAFCIGSLLQLTLVVEFVIMGVVLVLRPHGLLGKPPSMPRAIGEAPPPLAPPLADRRRVDRALPAGAASGHRYVTVAADRHHLFRAVRRQPDFIMGPAGMVSFATLPISAWAPMPPRWLFKTAGLPMELALVLAPFVAGLFRGGLRLFCVRLSGVISPC